jgi:hypothetical protein
MRVCGSFCNCHCTNDWFVTIAKSRTALHYPDFNEPFFAGFNPGPIIFPMRTLTSQSLEPGVYRTEPYACIVVVPEPQQDDCCIIGRTDKNSKMPMREPDLRFIPMSRKKK